MALAAIGAGLGIASSIGGFFGARSARKKQQRMIKKMMADRAKRIKAAKGQVQKSRRGLMAENRAAMNAAIAGAPQALSASLQRGSTSANYLRSIYSDAQRRANEIGRQTAAQMSELEMMSPYDIVDPSSMGAGKGAETQALLGGLSQLAGAFGEGGAFSGLFGGGSGNTTFQTPVGDSPYSPGIGSTAPPVTADNFGSNIGQGVGPLKSGYNF